MESDMRKASHVQSKDESDFSDYLAKHPELLEIISRSQATVSTRILRLPQAMEKMGRQGKSAFYAGVKLGMLPSSIPISVRSRGWLESELDAVIAARRLSSRTGQPIDMAKFVQALTQPLALHLVSGTVESVLASHVSALEAYLGTDLSKH
jgi:predicted DNA-binding transcriptional regulator AlpA